MFAWIVAALANFVSFSHWSNGEGMELSALLLVFREKCWCSPSGWNKWRFLLSLLLGAYWYCLQPCSLAVRSAFSSLCSYSQIANQPQGNIAVVTICNMWFMTTNANRRNGMGSAFSQDESAWFFKLSIKFLFNFLVM